MNNLLDHVDKINEYIDKHDFKIISIEETEDTMLPLYLTPCNVNIKFKK